MNRNPNRYFICAINVHQQIGDVSQSVHLALGYVPGEANPTIGGETTLCIPLWRLEALEAKIAKEVTVKDLQPNYQAGYEQAVQDCRMWIRAEIARAKDGK